MSLTSTEQRFVRRFAGSITVLLVSGTEDLTTAEIASLLGLTVRDQSR